MRRAFRGGAVGLVAAAVMGLAVGCGRVDTTTLLTQAGAAAQTGRWVEALDLTRRCLTAEENNVTAMVLQGIALHQVGRSPEAAQILEQAASLAPDLFAPQYFHGWILCERGRFADALVPLERASRHSVHRAEVLALLSRCCLEQNLPRGTTYLQALRRYPPFDRGPEVYTALAILWLRQGDMQRALDNLLKAQERAPANPAVLQNLAVFYDQYVHDLARARPYYEGCLAACQRGGDRTRERIVSQRLRELAPAPRPGPAPSRRGRNGGTGGTGGTPS